LSAGIAAATTARHAHVSRMNSLLRILSIPF
jgi:hypothetical protein